MNVECAPVSAVTLNRDYFSKVRIHRTRSNLSHAAADEDCCEEMAERYGWQLVDIEESGNPILEVDCVFVGETEFPKSYYDTEKEEY